MNLWLKLNRRIKFHSILLSCTSRMVMAVFSMGPSREKKKTEKKRMAIKKVQNTPDTVSSSAWYHQTLNGPCSKMSPYRVRSLKAALGFVPGYNAVTQLPFIPTEWAFSDPLLNHQVKSWARQLCCVSFFIPPTLSFIFLSDTAEAC